MQDLSEVLAAMRDIQEERPEARAFMESCAEHETPTLAAIAILGCLTTALADMLAIEQTL